MSAAKFITINDYEFIQELTTMAHGNLELVKEAIAASAEGPDGAADLKKVI